MPRNQEPPPLAPKQRLVPVTVSFSPEDLQVLESRAVAARRSFASIVRELISLGLAVEAGGAP